jgi:hypothetical protein
MTAMFLGFLPSIWSILLLIVFIYTSIGLMFGARAYMEEKAVGREADPKDLLAVGGLWLPLLISDPKSFNSVESLRVRAELKEQRHYERQAKVHAAQQQTLHKRVAVEKSRAELESTRTNAEGLIDQHRHAADQFIEQRHRRELAAASGEKVEKVEEVEEPPELAEVEIVNDLYNRACPVRYAGKRKKNNEIEIYDLQTKEWVPEWTALPGWSWIRSSQPEVEQSLQVIRYGQSWERR